MIAKQTPVEGEGFILNIQKLASEFKATFHHDDYRVFFAPGRINLIGEHTDYNGGHVFPCAITYGTYGVAQKRTDQLIRLFSKNFHDNGIIEVDLNDLEFNDAHGWANYPKGVIQLLRRKFPVIQTGMDILIYGNIPNGAGLSSSASIELLIGVIVQELFDINMDRIDLVKLGQQVENKYMGVNSGIMDQFAVGMGKRNSGILLDCQTLSYEYAPIYLENHHIIIMNTNKRRELAVSKYNERRSECTQALEQLQTVTDIEALCELTEEQFLKYQGTIDNDIIRKRAKHAVLENDRTLKALQALRDGELDEFGQLMNASHRSLRDDYEVTGLELDTLVEAAWKQEGVIGARMTGAGFGGCAIAIVEKGKTDDFYENVSKKYQDIIGYEATFYIANIGDGAKEIEKSLEWEI